MVEEVYCDESLNRARLDILLTGSEQLCQHNSVKGCRRYPEIQKILLGSQLCLVRTSRYLSHGIWLLAADLSVLSFKLLHLLVEPF